MDKDVVLKYGTDSLTVPIRGAARIRTVLPKEMERITDLPAAFLHAVEEGAIGSRPLKEQVGKDDPVTIVVSDITRSWMHQDQVLPLLIDYLHDTIGVPYEAIVILIALGTHRHSTPEELIKI